jgi:uncharacterized membrane protein YfcA
MDAAPSALEQRRAERVFHAANARACRGKSEVAACRAVRDARRLDDVEEEPEIGEIEVHGKSSRRSDAAFVMDEGRLRSFQIVPEFAATQACAMPDDFAKPLAVALVFLVAGLVKGMVGLGLPTVAMGLLSLFMTPAQAAALLVAPSLVTNLWQLGAGPSLRPLLRRFWPLLFGICAGTAAGMRFLVDEHAGRAAMALGVTLAAYAGLGLARPRLRLPAAVELPLAPVIGAVTGLITAATGVFVIPTVPFLQALPLTSEELVQALGLCFTVSTVALAAGLAQRGAMPTSIAGASLLALAPALCGMLVGQRLRQLIPPEIFRRCFLTTLLLLGLALALDR